MKKLMVVFVGMFCVVGATGKSFLSAQSFPKTFDDVSFKDKMEIMADGYDDFDPEYDENGVCISGCVYSGIKLQDELEMIKQNTQLANARLEQYKREHPEEFADQTQPAQQSTETQTPGQNEPVQQAAAQPQPVQQAVTQPQPVSQPTVQPQPVQQAAVQPQPVQQLPGPSMPSQTRTCAKYSNTIKPMNVVVQAPLEGDLVITSDFGARTRPCPTCSSNHRGIDLRGGQRVHPYIRLQMERLLWSKVAEIVASKFKFVIPTE